MNRRTLLKTGGLAAVGTLTLGAGPCSKRNLSFQVSVVIGALEELKPFLPGLSTTLSKAVAIAKSFDQAYRDGKFDSAMAIFENLVGVINQIIADAGFNVSDSVKIALAIAGVALRAIAVLLRDQVAADPQVAAAVRQKARTSAAGARQISLVESLANPKSVSAVFEAARP